MKLVAAITAYNEDLFLDEVIASTYDYIDEYIVTDVAIQCMVDAGYAPYSTDRTMEIIEKWKKKGDKFHIIQPKVHPKNYTELSVPNIEAAKELKGDWVIHLGADEIWNKNAIVPLKSFLKRCDKSGILGVNCYMHYFSPDMWHYKPNFYCPRIAKIAEDMFLPFSTGDVIGWKRGVWQSIELDKVPEHVRQVNTDYPFKLFHYSGVGKSRMEQKSKFYEVYEGRSTGSEPFFRYLNQDWDYFKNNGYINFQGRHPEIMKSHPLYNERLY